MQDPIKTKENNQRNDFTYVKSRERDTTVVNIGTRVEIVYMKNKTINVNIEKKYGHVIEE